MRTTKFLSVIICMVVFCATLNPVWAVESPGYTLAIPCRFDGYGGQYNGGIAVVQDGGKSGLIDKSGNVIVDFVYDNLYFNYPANSLAASRNYYVAIQNNKWGVIDRAGKPLIPCTYDSITITKGGLAVVGKGKTIKPGPGSIDGVWGIIDLSTGREIMPVKYKSIYTSNDSSLILIYQVSPLQYKFGVADRSGKLVVPLAYDNIVPTDDWRLFVVTQGKKTSLLDNSGKVIVPFGKYDYIGVFKSGLAMVSKKGKFGLVNTSGKIVIPTVYSKLEFYKGLAIVAKGGKCGVIKISGQLVIPFKYDYGGFIGNGAIFLKQKSKTTIFNSSGKVIAPAGKFDDVCIGTGYLGNTVFVLRKGKIGAIDMSGKQVFPLIYTGVREARNGLAIVSVNEKSAVINQDGKTLVPLDKYKNVNLLDDGNIMVTSEALKSELLDHSGKTILPYGYWGIGPMSDNYVVANNDKGFALFDKDGNMIVPFGEYDSIGWVISENMVDVRKNGLIGYITLPEYVEHAVDGVKQGKTMRITTLQ